MKSEDNNLHTYLVWRCHRLQGTCLTDAPDLVSLVSPGLNSDVFSENPRKEIPWTSTKALALSRNWALFSNLNGLGILPFSFELFLKGSSILFWKDPHHYEDLGHF